jgi:hypothetical protein
MHTHQKSSDPVAAIGLDIGRTRFTSSASTSAAQSPCASSYRAASVCTGLSIYRPALSASRPALARIVSRIACNRAGGWSASAIAIWK